jgi:hypothetical protein
LLEVPVAVDLFGGDLAREAQQTLINKFSGQNLLLRESLTRKLDLLRDEIAGPNPTPLERLLVERIVTCWLHLYYLETMYAGKENVTLELGSYYQRNISSAQKRFLAAIKTLAVVRKLAVPILQVNIARKQVNVAGPCVAADRERENPMKGDQSIALARSGLAHHADQGGFAPERVALPDRPGGN